MKNPKFTRNIIVFGIDSLFAEEVISGLIGEGSSLMLCGENQFRHQKLFEKFPESVVGYVTESGKETSSEYHKQIRVMIESVGSLDAVIYLLNPGAGKPLVDLSEQEIREIYDRNLVHPVLMLKAIYPYLKKYQNSKVIFVDASALVAGIEKTEIEHSTTMGISGLCDSIAAQMSDKGIDIRAITAQDQLYKDSVETQIDNPRVDQYYSRITEKIQTMMKSTNILNSSLNKKPTGLVSDVIVQTIH